MLAHANPARFMKLARRLLPWSAAAAAGLGVAGLALVWRAPLDYQQGEAVRIMFVHVPAAWMAMTVYGFIALMSAASIIWRAPLSDIAARAAALPGAGFTFLALATGALWGKPIWGAWWVWDARLASVLVLFFLYLGYLALWRAASADPVRAGRAAAILALAGAVNLPVIKFSVDWWNTLHQPASLLRRGGPALHPDFLLPLLIMAAAFAALFVFLLLARMQGEILHRKTLALLRAPAG